ncbi:MAG: aminomethyl-transferring glycine dehydrogenase subunit GcvPA [Thermoguttaceae bacterium]
MPYFPNTDSDRKTMLAAVGATSVDELFAGIPAELRLTRDLDVPPGLGEMSLSAHMADLARQNTPATETACFLGGGVYDHFVPAVVDMVASRSEFYTAYTPYQPEASQGSLQAFFEYQTLIAQLTGMDVSNASLYDGGSAAAEAVLMALHTTGRTRVVTAETVHPEYRRVLATYLANQGAELVTLDAPDGTISPEQLSAAVDDRTACVLLQHPNFFGCLEAMDEASEIAHRNGAMMVASVDPISLGLLKRPGDYGADIVVAEGQALGNPMAFGGPHLGILACREKFVRRMPGRLIGQTADRRGRRCWVLTLQTREQHIRREKATSNICTNQGLCALRATVYLACLGPAGLREVANLCLQKSRYAAERLSSPRFDRPTFKEFVVRVKNGSVEDLIERATRKHVFAGVPLGRWYPKLSDCLLVAVTEKRTRQEIDQLAEAFE